MALRVDWFSSPRIITVLAPLTEISVQEISDQIKDIEDEPANLAFPILILTFGKQPLGGGSFVGITAVLQNATIAFEARPGPTEEAMTINGGNLVAVDEAGSTINPISPTAFTQVTIQQSTSPSIATPPSDYAMLYLLEALNSSGGTKTLGNIFYWDPTGGSDTNDGSTPTLAVETFSKAHSLCTDGNNDVIFALANDASGITTVTTPIAITKDGVKLRGPGYPLQIIPSASGSDTLSINASNVEVSGLYIETAASGTDDAVTVTGTNNLVKDLWVASARGNGIVLSSATRTIIKTCAIENAGQSGTGDGISIGASSTLSKITNCIVTGSAGDGVSISGATISDNIFETNLIYNNGGYGIDIGTGVLRTGVRLNHTFSGNTSGATNDLGSQTFIESPSGGESASAIADAVWDELISDHTTAGTTGKTLRDAKTRATLASIT